MWRGGILSGLIWIFFQTDAQQMQTLYDFFAKKKTDKEFWDERESTEWKKFHPQTFEIKK